jgi:hypothetical protein
MKLFLFLEQNRAAALAQPRKDLTSYRAHPVDAHLRQHFLGCVWLLSVQYPPDPFGRVVSSMSIPPGIHAGDGLRLPALLIGFRPSARPCPAPLKPAASCPSLFCEPSPRRAMSKGLSRHKRAPLPPWRHWLKSFQGRRKLRYRLPLRGPPPGRQTRHGGPLPFIPRSPCPCRSWRGLTGSHAKGIRRRDGEQGKGSRGRIASPGKTGPKPKARGTSSEQRA